VPLFEYECAECGNIDERLEFGSEMEQDHYCSKCGKTSDRIVSKNHFKLIYNNKTDLCSWGYDGYASSQYWRDYKAAKARGEDVKPAGED